MPDVCHKLGFVGSSFGAGLTEASREASHVSQDFTQLLQNARTASSESVMGYAGIHRTKAFPA